MKRFLLLAIVFNIAFSGLTQPVSSEELLRKARRYANWGMEVNTSDDALKIFEYGLNLEKADSLEKAFTAYRLVFYFDSTASVATKAHSKLDSIAQLYPARQQTKLLGSWRWIWSGSNWGTDNTPGKCKCEKSIVFDKTTVYFLEGNEVKSSFEYYLRPLRNSRWKINYYLDIPGLKEKWTFGFGPQYWPIAAHDALLINREYGCVCGCSEETFEKIMHY